MWDKWFSVSSDQAGMIVLSGVLIYAVILLYTRFVGLRSFSKMSASDFAMTVAVGSLFASSVSQPSPTVGVAMVAFLTLYGGQWLMAYSRMRFKVVSQVIENQPLLLMKNGKILESNLRKANVTRTDVIAKLREANVLELSQVRAVVFETTGDISVLHTDDKSQGLEAVLLEGVNEK